jgi:hypothetical protein
MDSSSLIMVVHRAYRLNAKGLVTQGPQAVLQYSLKKGHWLNTSFFKVESTIEPIQLAKRYPHWLYLSERAAKAYRLNGRGCNLHFGASKFLSA